MGKKATFVAQRTRNQQQKRQIRQKRSGNKRSAETGRSTTRTARIAAPANNIELPKDQDVALLLNDPVLASRLPKPARDLGLLLQAHRRDQSSAADKDADAPAKKTKKEDGNGNATKLSKEATAAVLKAFLKDEDVTAQVAFDESGSRVLSTLLRTLLQFEMKKEAASLAAMFLKLSDDGSESLFLRMAEHHHARSVVWAAIEAAATADQAKMFEHIAPALESADGAKSAKKGSKKAAVEIDGTRIKDMVAHRHGAITLQKFIQSYPESRTVIAKALLDDSDEGSIKFADILKDPIGAPVVQALTSSSAISTEVSESLFAAVQKSEGGVKDILEDPKRGPRVLISMLGEERSEAAERIAQAIYDIGAVQILEMAADNSKNFLFQRVLKMASKELQKTMFDLVANTFFDLASHGVGVHVCIAFTSVDNADVRKALVKLVSPKLLELTRSRHGSLFVRKFIENVGSTMANLMQVLEKEIPSLIYDASGNLVVQQLIQHALAGRPVQEKQKFYERFIKDDLIGMCQHQFASHVVVKLFDVLDAQLISDISARLRPEVLNLIQHVNGRFVVDKLIGSFKDIRDAVIARFVELSQLKGTQHVLVRAYEVSDKKTRATIVKTILTCGMQMASHQQSSLVMQKLVQQSKSGEIKDDGAFHAEVKKHFNQTTRVMNSLRQDFFGKFVAQLL